MKKMQQTAFCLHRHSSSVPVNRMCDSKMSKQLLHCLLNGGLLRTVKGRCESQWQWGGCGSGQTLQTCHLSWVPQRNLSCLWTEIAGLPTVSSLMSFMSNTGQTSGKERYVGTKANLLIRLGNWGESWLARQRSLSSEGWSFHPQARRKQSVFLLFC